MTKRIVVTCDRCKHEDNFSRTINYPDDAGRLEELELCSDCWCDFHRWRWMRKEEKEDEK